MGSDTKETYELVDDISAKKDEPALRTLVAAGKVIIVPYAAKGTIRDVAFGKYLVEMEIGIETKRWWIAQEFIE
ncbi:hypothetical protein WG954_04830 [Lacibacter sp. H375]|uniref:hypothetical protein n=1 Tax=Lacibacter sp. H375 TaxID=3133424 RepID=UPI0030BA405F